MDFITTPIRRANFIGFELNPSGNRMCVRQAKPG
jgi:hypothetical protein